MAVKQQKDRIHLNKVTHSVRAAQAVLQYGVGAMVDFPDQTLMTAAPEYWDTQTERCHDERLEKLLKVDWFGLPGSKDDPRFKDGISFVRFPEWYFCPKCRRFQSLADWKKEYDRKMTPRVRENDPYMVKHMRCPNPTCKQELVVARIITVCEDGHIDDFPWIKWVHARNRGGRNPKPICNDPKLTFKTGASSTEGLEGLEIRCTCGAVATLKDAFVRGKLKEIDKETDYRYGFGCAGRHPWKHTKEACDKDIVVYQRGGSSVYFPVIESSLVIPPYSALVTGRIEKSSAFDECKTKLTVVKMIDDASQREKVAVGIVDEYTNRISIETGIKKESVRDILERKFLNPVFDERYTTSSVKYRAEEYEALNGEAGSIVADGDFIREQVPIEQYNMPWLKQISLIHKVREVQALVGFTRCRPAERVDNTDKAGKIVSIKEDDTNWYPAYEVRGEGIFLEFDSTYIDQWRNNNTEMKRRIDIMNEKYSNSYFGASSSRTVTSKFVLLHSVSHLLIKQLSFECGYNIASIKERIYCSEPDEGKEMNGIFIYTASGDSEGTMGGLVRQGRPDAFPRIFNKAIESSRMCSNDPVCSLSNGQGRDSLNLSACYSCTLIPETSCEEFNVFLDRGALIGTYVNREFGFFSRHSLSDRADAVLVKGTKTAETENEKELVITDRGIDMRDMEYPLIWGNLLQYSADEHERVLISELARLFDDQEIIEKPYGSAEFLVSGVSDVYTADLIWIESKTAWFSSESQDSYMAAKDTQWKCFCGSDRTLSAKTVVQSVKGI